MADIVQGWPEAGCSAQISDVAIQEAAASWLATQPPFCSGLLTAKQLVCDRQRRRFIMGEPLFRDVIWDILLDIYIAQAERSEISVTSVGIAAGIPPSTALRWLKSLARSGHLTRCPDQRDARRTIVALAPKTLEQLSSYLSLPAQLSAERIPILVKCHHCGGNS